MSTRDERPVFLNLFKIRLPLNGLVSILHRVSGVVMLFSLPWVLSVWSHSLASPKSFRALQNYFYDPYARLLAFVVMMSWVYHALAGARHLIMDFGVGESLCASRFSSGLVLLLTFLAACCLGVWLW